MNTALPPGPRSPVLVQGLRFGFRDLAFYEECGRRFGDVFTIRLPDRPLVLFTSPSAVREIFTTARPCLRSASGILKPLFGPNALPLLDGAKHARDRRLLHAPLHGERLVEYGRAMLAITDGIVDEWSPGQSFSMESEFQKITFEVLFKIVFGFSEEETQRLGGRLRKRVAAAPNPIWLWPPLQIELGSITPWGRYIRAMRDVTAALIEVIKQHRKIQDFSVLSQMMAARDVDGTSFTDEELRDELITFMLAGFDTTATALTWAIYDIFANPSVLLKLRRELNETAASGALEVEDVMKMPYLDACIKESLRLHPIIAIMSRLVDRPVRIGNWTLPAGVNVGPCIYLIHRRQDLWPDPLRFDPERFLGNKQILDETPDGDRTLPSAYRYLPFGGGDRRCIGMAFTLNQMKFVIAQLLRRADLCLVPYRMQIKRKVMTFAPSRGLPVIVTQRDDSTRYFDRDIRRAAVG